MIDLAKFDKIASELEAKLGIVAEEQSLQKEIDERTEKEKETVDTPTPSVEAADEVETIENVESVDVKEEATARIAHLKRLIKLAKNVKKSKKMSAEEKQEAMNKIEKSAKLTRTADDLAIKRNDLNKQLTNDTTKIMKTPGALNKLTQEEKGITLREMLEEMKSWGVDNDADVKFPSNLLGKNLGSCNIDWLIKLGPMVATLVKKYNDMKNRAE